MFCCSRLTLRCFPAGIAILPCVVSILAASPGDPKTISPPAAAIVIGFVGGFVHNDNAVHEEVRLAAHLRDERPGGMQTRIFKNREGRQAHEAILQLLAGSDGALSDEEKRAAHIVLYGHS
jgi:hypothetical protein